MMLLSLLMLSLPAYAVDLTFVNKTSTPARIDALGSRCAPKVVSEKKPVRLAPGATVVFKNMPNVIHTFTVCGGGWCSSSAVGFKSHRRYTVLVTLTSYGLIDTTSVPDEWPGNIDCPKK